MTRLYAYIAVAVVVAGLGGTWVATQLAGPASDDRFAACRTGAIAGDAAIGGPFELVDTTGRTVTDADVITEPSILYFGYTFCPDVCPLDASRNADAVDLLAERGLSVTPVFISIDPARDTPEVLADFTANLHDKMIGLTGSPEQVAAASRAYKTYYKAQPATDNYYLVDHSNFSYLVLPGHGFVEFFRGDTTADRMAETTACFIDNA